jgi:hypothetical protein
VVKRASPTDRPPVRGALEELAREADKLKLRAIASFTSPRFPTRQVIKLGVPRSTLTNWLTKKEFDLDADKQRAENSSRLFSPRDGVLLTCASNLVAIGVPLAIAKEVANLVARSIESSFSIRMSIVAHRLAIFRDGESWVVASPHAAPPGSSSSGASCRIFSGDNWQDVTNREGGIPPVHIEFNVDEFSNRVMDNLGFVIIGKEGSR